MINYLFSGIDKNTGFNDYQSYYLKQDITNNSKIVFIAARYGEFQVNDNQMARFIEHFNKIGIKFSKVDLIDDRLNKKEAKEILSKADIIFLTGGAPHLQMKIINKLDLIEDIKKSKLVIGVSAGSMNQSKRVMYKDDFDNYKLVDYSGLGLVDINVFPHVENNKDKLYEEAFEISKTIPLIALPSNSFVRIKDKKVEIFGKYYKL